MTYANTLNDARVAAILARMFAEAEQDDAVYEHLEAERRSAEALEPMTDQERADAWARLYLPISPEGGRLLYSLVRATRPATVVEFGMSFGISTLHLAAAVRDNGVGRVVTTEMSASKVATARKTFAEAGLDDLIMVLEGDALETLPAHVGEGVGFVLLDGWKALYLPVLHLLEPHLAPGTLVIGDDADMESVKPYLEYVRDPANGYQSTLFPVEDGMEISSRL